MEFSSKVGVHMPGYTWTFNYSVWAHNLRVSLNNFLKCAELSIHWAYVAGSMGNSKGFGCSSTCWGSGAIAILSLS